MDQQRDESYQKILSVLDTDIPMTCTEIADKANFPPECPKALIIRYLEQLEKDNKVVPTNHITTTSKKLMTSSYEKAEIITGILFDEKLWLKK